jgi:hypothetical protein
VLGGIIARRLPENGRVYGCLCNCAHIVRPSDAPVVSIALDCTTACPPLCFSATVLPLWLSLPVCNHHRLAMQSAFRALGCCRAAARQREGLRPPLRLRLCCETKRCSSGIRRPRLRHELVIHSARQQSSCSHCGIETPAILEGWHCQMPHRERDFQRGRKKQIAESSKRVGKRVGRSEPRESSGGGGRL